MVLLLSLNYHTKLAYWDFVLMSSVLQMSAPEKRAYENCANSGIPSKTIVSHQPTRTFKSIQITEHAELLRSSPTPSLVLWCAWLI